MAEFQQFDFGTQESAIGLSGTNALTGDCNAKLGGNTMERVRNGLAR